MPKTIISLFLLIVASLAAEDFEHVRAILDQHCVKCHGPEKQKAKIDFTKFTDHDSILAADDIWAEVRFQVEDGEMPPDDEPEMNEETREQLLDWYRAMFEAVTEPVPGPSPPRRLTRREYQNSLEDLLGIQLQQQIGEDGFRYMKAPPTIVEQYFSPDPPGASGFDNDAATLAFNDTMLIKYLQVAQYAVGQIDSFEKSRALVFGTEESFRVALKPEEPETPKPRIEVAGVIAPVSAELTAGPGAFPVENLINGSGLGSIESIDKLNLVKHDEFSQGNAFTTAPRGGDYFSSNPIGEAPVIVFNLGAQLELTDVAIWGYSNGRLNANEASALTLEFSTDGGKTFGEPLKLTRKLTGNDCEVLSLGDKQLANVVRMTLTDNHAGKPGIPGGDRVGLSEIRLLNPALAADADEPEEPETEPVLAVFDSPEPVLNRFAERAWRRPVQADELIRYLEIFESVKASGADFDTSIKEALSGILTSPQFIFRVEEDHEAESWKISDYELATRLSYFLWSSTPDQQLQDLASAGELSNPSVIRKQIARMIASPKIREFSRNFAGQWIGFNEILAPEVIGLGKNSGVKRRLAMYDEALLFFEALVRRDADIFQFIESKETNLNGQLAGIYGEKNFRSKGARIRGREDNADPLIPWTLTDPNRGGYLTMPATMLMTSAPQRTSPIRRGVWVLDAILGTPVPEPPPAIPALEEVTAPGGKRKLTVREQMEIHAAQENCMKCHEQIDPLGIGLENFGPGGNWRTKDGTGEIDATGVLPDGQQFSNPAELREILLRDFRDEIRRNVTERMLAYALGRRLRYFDEPVIQQLLTRLEQNDDRISELILGIVESRPFREREREGLTR